MGATGLHPNPEDFSSLETFDKDLAAAIVPEHAQEFDSITERHVLRKIGPIPDYHGCGLAMDLCTMIRYLWTFLTCETSVGLKLMQNRQFWAVPFFSA